jgi:hypothetical protein
MSVFPLAQAAFTAFAPALALFQDYDSSTYSSPTFDSTFLLIYLLIMIPVMVIVIVGMWKVFTKAGQPGWASIVPIYNMIVLLEIAGKPLWWFVLMLIPFVNIVIFIIVMIDVAKNFGKGAGFGVGLALLGFIFFPILGFGDARYMGYQPPQPPPPPQFGGTRY